MEGVGVAELKARLSEYLRRVRRGQEVTILDRNTPIARMVPHETRELVQVRAPRGRVPRFQDVPLPKVAGCGGVDVTELLLEDRGAGR